MPVVVAAEEPVHHQAVQETTAVLMECQDHLQVEHLHPDQLQETILVAAVVVPVIMEIHKVHLLVMVVQELFGLKN
jgi:hypothetical protein